MTVLSRLLNDAPLSSEQDHNAAEATVPPVGAEDSAVNRVANVDAINLEVLLSSAVSADPVKLQEAIAAIEDAASLRKLAIEGGSTAVRQLAAHAIKDPDELRDL